MKGFLIGLIGFIIGSFTVGVPAHLIMPDSGLGHVAWTAFALCGAFLGNELFLDRWGR